MTLAEIMAGLGASQAVGGARTGALLTQTAEGERRQLLDAQRRLEEQENERKRKARRREKRRGIGRLIGGAAGALLALPTGGLSLAAGAALGSAAGQAGAALTQRGGYKLGDVSSGLGEGMFFKGGRENISSAEREINRYLDEANQGFLSNIAASAASDFLTISSLGKLGGVEKYGAIAAEKGRGAALGELFKENIFDPIKSGLLDRSAETAISSTVGSSGSLAGGTLGRATESALERFRFDKGFYGGGFDATNLGNFGTNYSKRSLYNPLLSRMGG